ncbi:MAG: DEAD/DEAH box helicase family protein, partial [Candidatus Micrarchaeota archaeon]|nr:DEAD/DEAH box helicase family protein [Candidatus Micrarchaeota archaeon]
MESGDYLTTPDFSFQDEAVSRVISDFKKNPQFRNLVIVPTGGGKTIIAIKVVNKMIEQGLITNKEYVIWVTHRINLRAQVKEEISDPKNIKKYKLNKNLHTILKVCMKKEASEILSGSRNSGCRLLIIDEAHHSAAPTYKPFFRNKIGILGLTATPTRTDSYQLEFDSVSYSISFSELVQKGVIIKPVFENVYTTETIDVKSLDQS